jgi:hypothetical protein
MSKDDTCGSINFKVVVNSPNSVNFVLTNNIDLRDTGAIGTVPHLRPLAMEACKHPRVRVLTREEDAEFVECLECGEVFDSHEFTDMDIEEKSLKNGEELDE